MKRIVLPQINLERINPPRTRVKRIKKMRAIHPNFRTPITLRKIHKGKISPQSWAIFQVVGKKFGISISISISTKTVNECSLQKNFVKKNVGL